LIGRVDENNLHDDFGFRSLLDPLHVFFRLVFSFPGYSRSYPDVHDSDMQLDGITETQKTIGLEDQQNSAYI